MFFLFCINIQVPEIGRSSSEAIQTNPTLVRNLLNPPQSHVLVIDRMHSGKDLTIKYGKVIRLTVDVTHPSHFRTIVRLWVVPQTMLV